jgi:hypothetical protein
VDPPKTLILTGTVTCKDPALEVGPCLRAAHQAGLADRLSELSVDVSGLSFVNSSAIRLFVDWIGWIKDAKGGAYKLRFLTQRKVTWQRLSFSTLEALAGGLLIVEQAD